MANIRHLCLLFAMQAEAEGFVTALRLQSKGQLDPNYPMHLYQAETDQLLISVVVAGEDERYGVDYVGTEPAVLMTHLALSALQPDLVMTTGTAGGFTRHGNQIGDIVISDEYFVYHDHHVPIEGLHESAIGRYPALNARQLCVDLGFHFGVISSGSSLAKQNTDIENMGLFDARAKDMEAAAVAWVAMLRSVPCMAVKAITNLVDEDNRSEDEFLTNFAKATEALTTALLKIIAYLPGKQIAQLGR